MTDLEVAAEALADAAIALHSGVMSRADMDDLLATPLPDELTTTALWALVIERLCAVFGATFEVVSEEFADRRIDAESIIDLVSVCSGTRPSWGANGR